MNSIIPIYDVVLDDESLGLTAISLVDKPAIQTDFLAFADTLKQNIWMSSREKREIVSPILIPNQLILRQSEDGQFYYIRWTEETIKLAAEKYLQNGWFNNFTVNHPTFYNKDMKYEDALEKDVYMLRMWIIEDEAKDDANTKYGFSLPKGTLMVHFKVHNRKIWQRIKSGDLRGLSIEAFSNIVKAENNITIKQNKMDINIDKLSLFQKFIQFLNEVSNEASDIADVAKADATDSGDVTLKYFIDDEHWIEVDAEGFARDAEGNLVAEGEYELADGNVLVVDANNKFVETKAKSEVKEEPVEAPIAEKKIEDEKDDEKDDEKPEGEVSGDEGKTDDVADKPESEGDADGDAEDAEDDDEKKRKVAHAEIDEVPATLVPFEINGVEYQLPQEVVDYINSLVAGKDEAVAEVQMLKEQTPSVKPIPTVISQGAEEHDNLYNAIRLLNRKK